MWLQCWWSSCLKQSKLWCILGCSQSNHVGTSRAGHEFTKYTAYQILKLLVSGQVEPFQHFPGYILIDKISSMRFSPKCCWYTLRCPFLANFNTKITGSIPHCLRCLTCWSPIADETRAEYCAKYAAAWSSLVQTVHTSSNSNHTTQSKLKAKPVINQSYKLNLWWRGAGCKWKLWGNAAHNSGPWRHVHSPVSQPSWARITDLCVNQEVLLNRSSIYVHNKFMPNQANCYSWLCLYLLK